MSRKPYPSDISDEEWHFVAPYLALIDEQAPQRRYELREVFNALRWLTRAGAPWRLLPNDLPPWQMVYQQFRRWSEADCFEAMVSDMRSVIRASEGRNGTKVHMAVDTLGQLIALTVTAASEQERAQVKQLCDAVQQATGEIVKLAWADQGYTGQEAKQAASDCGIDLQVVKPAQAKRGFVLMPRRWVVERSFGWLARFRRLSRDFERMPQVLAALHFVMFVMLMSPKVAALLTAANST